MTTLDVGYDPPLLVTILSERRGADDVARADGRFTALTGRHPSMTLQTRTWVAPTLVGPSTQVSVDEVTGRTAVLHGELLGRVVDLGEVMEGFSERPDIVARNLEGSYALMIADPSLDRITFVTDRTGSRRLFWGRCDGGILVSSDLRWHRPWAKPDPVGVAWYLSNGAVHKNRTTLADVLTLDRASTHHVTAGDIRSAPYWTFDVGAGTRRDDESTLADDLAGLVVGAVQRHVADAPDIFLSLSGGFDARAVAGVLGLDLEVPDVRCFSYLLGEPRRDSDEVIAAQIAREVGYSHELLQSYQGDFVRAINDNALLGEGLRHFVHEIDAWASLAERLVEIERPVVIAGDECLGGGGSHRLATDSDVLESVGIRPFDVASSLRRWMPANDYDAMESGVSMDIRQVLDRCPGTDDARDCRDFLYLDQRLANVVLPWRERFGGRYATIRNPLLDSSLLDFIATVPGPLRREKRLFRTALTRLYPQLASLPRAKQSNYMVDLRSEIVRNEAEVRWMLSQPGGIADDVLPHDLGVQLLREVLEPVSPKQALRRRVKDVSRGLLPAGTSAVVRRRTAPQRPTPLDAATLLVRVLILRSALRLE